MKINMTVFSVDDMAVETQAFLSDGSPVTAQVPGKRVQLVSATHGSWTLNLTGAEAAAWTTPAGGSVDVTIV
jgi:hypothetical protein